MIAKTRLKSIAQPKLSTLNPGTMALVKRISSAFITNVNNPKVSMNLIPAFMPPTWAVLAFFYITFNLALLPTIIIGAVTATLGRICLALLARYYFRPFLSKAGRENYETLGFILHKHRKITIPII